MVLSGIYFRCYSQNNVGSEFSLISGELLHPVAEV